MSDPFAGDCWELTPGECSSITYARAVDTGWVVRWAHAPMREFTYDRGDWPPQGAAQIDSPSSVALRRDLDAMSEKVATLEAEVDVMKAAP